MLPASGNDNSYVFGAPVIDSVEPGGGPLTGGNTVVITGSGFMNPALTPQGVVFDPTSDTDGSGAIAGTDVDVVSDTEIDVTAPDATDAAFADFGSSSVTTHVTAKFQVTGTGVVDNSAPAAQGDNTYEFGAPVIDSVEPGGGPLTGGNTVVITGSGFKNPALTPQGVVFDPPGDTDGSEAIAGTDVDVVSDTEIDVTAPDATDAAFADFGSSSVTTHVTAQFSVPDGVDEIDNSVPAAQGDNSYVFGAPVIDSVEPGGGPLTGGNTVVITGSGFMNPALTPQGVVFDPPGDTDGSEAIAGTDVDVVSDTEIDVTAPDATAAAAGDASLETDVTAEVLGTRWSGRVRQQCSRRPRRQQLCVRGAGDRLDHPSGRAPVRGEHGDDHRVGLREPGSDVRQGRVRPDRRHRRLRADRRS